MHTGSDLPHKRRLTRVTLDKRDDALALPLPEERGRMDNILRWVELLPRQPPASSFPLCECGRRCCCKCGAREQSEVGASVLVHAIERLFHHKEWP